MKRSGGRAELPDLMVITDPETEGWLDILARVVAEVPGHRLAVQLRNKQECDRRLLDQAKELRAITQLTGATLFVNGRPDIARLVGADGVHLPESSFPEERVRQILGPAHIGRSVHDLAGIRSASSDYVTLSPFMSSPGKSAPLGLPRFSELVKQTSIPVFALGGLDTTHVAPAIESGAYGVAVVRAIFGVRDPVAAAKKLLAALDRARCSER